MHIFYFARTPKRAYILRFPSIRRLRFIESSVSKLFLRFIHSGGGLYCTFSFRVRIRRLCGETFFMIHPLPSPTGMKRKVGGRYKKRTVCNGKIESDWNMFCFSRISSHNTRNEFGKTFFFHCFLNSLFGRKTVTLLLTISPQWLPGRLIAHVNYTIV